MFWLLLAKLFGWGTRGDGQPVNRAREQENFAHVQTESRSDERLLIPESDFGLGSVVRHHNRREDENKRDKDGK